MNIQATHSDNLAAYLEDVAAPIIPDRTNPAPASRGVTVGIGTYYFPLNVPDWDLMHITMRWAGAVAGVFTIETTDFPGHDGGTDDVTHYQASGQDWDVENASQGFASVAGVGNSVTGGTGTGITAGGTNAGKARINLFNTAAKRHRIKLVTTVGGLVRIGCNAKRQGQ